MEKKKEKLNNPSTSLRISAKPRKVAIAMSGGVDSSVAAKILKDQGYDVVGFMMKLWSDPDSCGIRENACCDEQGVLDAKKVADQLGIPFYLVNAKEIFKKEVTDYFLNEYKNLRTPNPCVVCNEKIKFGWLLDFAKKTGCDYLATGHYARIAEGNSGISNTKFLISNQFQNSNDLNIKNSDLNKNLKLENKNLHLLCGADVNKDQTYFLYSLTQEQLSQIMFPVGQYTKEEVRAMAKKWDLPVFEKRESQEICFIHDKDFREFLKRNIPAKYFTPGDIVDKKANVLGKHEGLINYTIGQRKGIEQARGLQISKSKLQISNKIQITKSKISKQIGDEQFAIGNKQPLYVVGFDAEKNQLIVGEDAEVYEDKMRVEVTSWINNINESQASNIKNLKVKIRYRHPAVKCKIKSSGEQLEVIFDEPQRAITPGQSAVFYDGDQVLGGGTIQQFRQ